MQRKFKHYYEEIWQQVNLLSTFNTLYLENKLDECNIPR